MPELLESTKARLINEGGLKELFDHIRNLLMAALIIASGAYGIKQPATFELISVFDAQVVGYIVLVIGVLLALLNALDGLHRLNKQQLHIGFRVATVILYLVCALRIVQLVVLLRGN
jgi:hypothetical protein